MGPRGKHQTGFCSYCGTDVAIRKSDGKVFRHPNPDDVKEVCPGVNKYPTYLLQEDMSLVRVISEPNNNLEAPIPEDREEELPTQILGMTVLPKPRHSSERFYDPTEKELLLGKDFPVYTESGHVIGRARIEVGRILMLGPKWKNYGR